MIFFTAAQTCTEHSVFNLCWDKAKLFNKRFIHVSSSYLEQKSCEEIVQTSKCGKISHNHASPLIIQVKI